MSHLFLSDIFVDSCFILSAAGDLEISMQISTSGSDLFRQLTNFVVYSVFMPRDICMLLLGMTWPAY